MGLFALVGVVVLVFFMIHAIPGDPVDNLLGEQVQAADKEAFRRRLHLDEGLGAQFARYMGNIGDGTLGRSYMDPSVTVSDRIGEVLPYTL
ncbi:MAG: glutathione ABC transporter permease GsiC, partial [Deltaproteobacteria bacterium HGW-Deltaproteobacteria-22]